MTYWKIKGRELANCTCDYGCNCQFGGLPDKGHCHASFGLIIDEGKGECVAFVDETADEAQRNALLTIMTGGDTDPMATMFAVFASTVETMHEPLFVPMDVDIDVQGRKARIRIGDIVEVDGEPIKSPVDGREVRALIYLPDGFEYEYADIGSASTRARGPVPLNLSDSYGQFADIHLDSHGVVRSQ